MADDWKILLGEVKGLVQRALEQHDRLVQKLENDSRIRASELQSLREFIEDEDSKLKQAVHDAETRALKAAEEAGRKATEAQRSVDTLPRAITHEQMGRAGLTAWQLLAGALWSLFLLGAAHYWK